MGIESLLQQNIQNAGLAGSDRLARNAMFPQSQMDKTQYAVSSQMPTSAETIRADYDTPSNAYTGLPSQPFAKGGIASILRYDMGGEITSEAPVEEQRPLTMDELAAQLNEAYRYNQNYDDIWKQFAATKEQDPQEWYRKQLGFLGGQEGWQIGQNTSERNAALQPQIQDTVAQARAAGLNDEEISNILGSSNQSANYANQRRIAEEAAKGKGWVNQNIPGGWTTVAALAAAAAAPYALGAMGAGSAGTTGALTTAELLGGAGGAFVPTAGSGASFLLPTATTATTAAAGLPSLKQAYNAYNMAKTGVGVLGALSGNAGRGGEGQTTTYGNQGINNPYAMATGFNPGPVRSGLGISDYTPVQMQPTLLSRLSEFKGDYESMAAGGVAQGGTGIGHLGGYSDGGRLLKGPGDGMSDHIPATIGGKQPARLAEGEFVIPADVVSHLGNGSTDAGAKQLYKMMNKIRKARTGNPKQGKQINPDKFTPKG